MVIKNLDKRGVKKIYKNKNVAICQIKDFKTLTVECLSQPQTRCSSQQTYASKVNT